MSSRCDVIEPIIEKSCDRHCVQWPLNILNVFKNIKKVIETLQTPDGIGAAKYVHRLPRAGFSGAIFPLSENPMLGTWSVQASYLSKVSK